MNELFKLILKLSIPGSIFFVVFNILSLFTKKIFSAKWHLLFLKINMIFYFIPIVAIYDFLNKGSQSVNIKVLKNVNINSLNIAFNEMGNNSYSIKISEYLFTIWILGLVIISSWNLYCYKRFIKSLKLSSYNDKEIEDAVYRCKKKLNISSKIEVKRSYIATSPMIIGILNPTIIFPSNMEYSQKLEPVITHELIHYKRKDLLFKMVQLIIITINWFNPIVYIMNIMFEKWCEISCDEIVAENMSYSERKEYGETVLGIIERLNINLNNLCFYLCNDKKYIKRRLMMMLNMKKSSKFKRTFGGALVCAVVLFSAGVSVAATTSNVNLVSKEEASAININGMAFEDTIKIAEENGVSFTIDTDDDVRRFLISQLDELKDDTNINGTERGAMVIVDTKSGEVLATASYNRQ